MMIIIHPYGEIVIICIFMLVPRNVVGPSLGGNVMLSRMYAAAIKGMRHQLQQLHLLLHNSHQPHQLDQMVWDVHGIQMGIVVPMMTIVSFVSLDLY